MRKAQFHAFGDIGVCYRDNDPELTDEVGVYSHCGDVDVSLRVFRDYLLAYLRAAIPHGLDDPDWLYGQLPEPVRAVLDGRAELRYV